MLPVASAQHHHALHHPGLAIAHTLSAATLPPALTVAAASHQQQQQQIQPPPSFIDLWRQLVFQQQLQQHIAVSAAAAATSESSTFPAHHHQLVLNQMFAAAAAAAANKANFSVFNTTAPTAAPASASILSRFGACAAPTTTTSTSSSNSNSLLPLPPFVNSTCRPQFNFNNLAEMQHQHDHQRAAVQDDKNFKDEQYNDVRTTNEINTACLPVVSTSSTSTNNIASADDAAAPSSHTNSSRSVQPVQRWCSGARHQYHHHSHHHNSSSSSIADAESSVGAAAAAAAISTSPLPSPTSIPFFNLRRANGRRLSKPRRARTAFTSEQTDALEGEYKNNEYISKGRRNQLAAQLALTEVQIKIWYQNRRAKDKRIEKAKVDRHSRLYNPAAAAAAAALATTTALEISSFSGTIATEGTTNNTPSSHHQINSCNAGTSIGVLRGATTPSAAAAAANAFFELFRQQQQQQHNSNISANNPAPT